ncbi:MAG TPA: hypothetical protein VG870_01795 [Chitinophagaceae bacterium]|nr:hypothetical protein [Chitinophagaceae bacterium]
MIQRIIPLVIWLTGVLTVSRAQHPVEPTNGLTITGAVKQELHFSLNDLARLPATPCPTCPSRTTGVC